MKKVKFTTTESIQLEEIRRRVKEFKGGDKNKPMIYLGLPTEVKGLIRKGIIIPYSKETPRVLNWYNLTELGKQYI